MAFVPLEFKEFDAARLKATRTAWMEDADRGLAFPTEIERLLDWVATHTSPSEHDSVAFGVFAPGKKVAMGISEVVIHRETERSKWVKMLRLHLKPSVDAALQEGETDDAMNVFLSSILGSLRLQLTHNATKLKIYGRTGEQLGFLRMLVGQLNAFPDTEFKASIEGRFLTLTYKQQTGVKS